MDKKRYNALYYARNKERILSKRRDAERGVSEISMSQFKRYRFLIWAIGMLLVFTSVYEAYQFYRIDSSCEYAALKALVIESALIGLPFLGGGPQRLKQLGSALVIFSGLVMMFSGLKEFCHRSSVTGRLPHAIARLEDQLKFDLDRIDLYEKRGWATRAHELSQDVRKLLLRKAVLESELNAEDPLWLLVFKLLLQSLYRLLLMVVAWVYVSAIAGRQNGESA